MWWADYLTRFDESCNTSRPVLTYTHDRSILDCDAAEYDSESECLSSLTPHALRRGGIIHHLNNKVPQDVVSDRANVSREVDTHYDQRSDEEKMVKRRQYLDNI